MIMQKRELIKTMKELGVYKQWAINVKNDEAATRKGIHRSLLNSGYSFYVFIRCSFTWRNTPEKHEFWDNIAKSWRS